MRRKWRTSDGSAAATAERPPKKKAVVASEAAEELEEELAWCFCCFFVRKEKREEGEERERVEREEKSELFSPLDLEKSRPKSTRGKTKEDRWGDSWAFRASMVTYRNREAVLGVGGLLVVKAYVKLVQYPRVHGYLVAYLLVRFKPQRPEQRNHGKLPEVGE